MLQFAEKIWELVSSQAKNDRGNDSKHFQVVCEKTQTVIVEMEHVTLSQRVSDGYLCVFFHVRRKSHHNGIT